ncbi:protein-glutamate methylesterase/protein-glutamine glutaminase [Anaerosporobacter faecicola]|uniref:protein-glutamate methylesterase/protein-glutamine glutaminase n=1 Tax=Anaerosporobacter faecicola TaxID=2718714 RepID=UPI0014393A35|nr:chemotaxis response regulator protein-glutamate methylesterase [Anaerosporobacter faecicola]
MRRIKILVVEDSIVFRELLIRMLKTDPVLDVVATANNPYEARDAILEYHPDVMTLDIELPRMNGIEFLRKLMPQYPLPTVVISALSEGVFEALDAGAVDFVNKPSGMNGKQLADFMRNELITKVKIASTVKVGNLKRLPSSPGGRIASASSRSKKIIAIGASTGGTEAIFDVVKCFDRDIPGVVIVQHMPPGFTKMYAERLNNQCVVSVKEAQTGMQVLPGQVLIAPGDAHMRLIRMNGGYQVECKKGERVSGHCPSVDVLFESVAKAAGKDGIGVILTGMGADGAQGLLNMRQVSAETIGQNEASCVVYGMPKVAYEIGAVKYQIPLNGIAQKIYSLLDN